MTTKTHRETHKNHRDTDYKDIQNNYKETQNGYKDAQNKQSQGNKTTTKMLNDEQERTSTERRLWCSESATVCGYICAAGGWITLSFFPQVQVSVSTASFWTLEMFLL